MILIILLIIIFIIKIDLIYQERVRLLERKIDNTLIENFNLVNIIKNIISGIFRFISKTVGPFLMSICKFIFPMKVNPIELKPETEIKKPKRPILGCIDFDKYKKIIMGNDPEESRKGREKAVQMINDLNQFRSSLSNVCNIIGNVIKFVVDMVKKLFSREDYNVFKNVNYRCSIPLIPIGNLRLPEKMNWSCALRV